MTRTVVLTACAMIAFAANSVLCRIALGAGTIDAASFASVRVLAGALTLGLISLPRWRRQGGPPIDWRSATMLFAYLVCFSFAYLSLATGTGALILFGAVQLTMLAAALRAGESLSAFGWLGFALAAGGLVWLVAPGVTAPDAPGALLMAVAGIAWGAYSLFGRSAADPLAATASNFLAAVPLVIGVSLLFMDRFAVSAAGLALAAVSGALTSGLGYVVWYAALEGLTATRAATVQLSVPVIAAVAGTALLAEPVTLRLVAASAATLGGVWIVLATRAAPKRPQKDSSASAG